MKTFKLSIIGLLFLAISCQKDDLSTINTSQNASKSNISNSRLYTVYVLDSRFSRSTCWTGPGVCFKDGFGNIWDYSPLDYSTNPDVGPIGVTILDNKLNLSFYRSLEEDIFIIEQDVNVNTELAHVLGKKSIILKAGKYKVNYDNSKYGSSNVDVIMQ